MLAMVTTTTDYHYQLLASQRELTNSELLSAMRPTTPWRVLNFPHIFRGFREIVLRRAFGTPRPYGMLFAKFGDEDCGLISLQTVTNLGAAFMVDAAQNIYLLSRMRYHSWGTGNTPEHVTNVNLDAELTTQITPPNLRAIGNLQEFSNRVFKTTGLTTINTGMDLREWGLWTGEVVGTGVLVDRAVFSPKAVSANIIAVSNYFLEFIPKSSGS